jgi:hypothetical protein
MRKEFGEVGDKELANVTRFVFPNPFGRNLPRSTRLNARILAGACMIANGSGASENAQSMRNESYIKLYM